MTKARDLGKLVSQGQLLADGVVQASEVSGLATVATTGSYNDLTNKPTITGSGTTDYTQLTNKPNLSTVATTGSYNDLINKPSLSTVATTGSYNDLVDKPTNTGSSGTSDKLVNGSQQFILGTDGNLTLPGNTSILTSEDSIAIVPDISKSTGIQVDAPGTGTNHVVTIQTNSNGWFFKSDGKIAFPDSTQQSTAWTGSVNYSNVTNKPTLATVATSGSYTDLTNKPTIPTVPTLATVATSGSYTDLTNKPTIPTLATVATSGSYTDLTNKPTIPTVPTLATVATSGSYTDLTNKPTEVDPLPTQTNNSGKFLTTNGSTTSWATLPIAPSAPLNVTATASSTSGQIDISWTAAVGATSYLIYYSTSNPVTLTSSVMSASTNSGTITGLTSTYSPVYVAVVSSNTYGNSGLSAQTNATPKTSPTAPSITSASASSGTSINVSWTGSSNGNPTATYRLYYSTSSPVTTSSSYIAASSSPTNLTGLTANTTYYFAVGAVNTQGTTLSSQTSAITPPAGTTIYSAGQQLSITGNSSQVFFIDASVTYFTVRCAGGGGGGGGSWNYSGANGAVGGYADAKIFKSSAADSVFIAYSGGAGSGGCNYQGAGYGGGASAIVGYSTNIDYVVGGAGGGGGSGWNGPAGAGGAGGVISNSTGYSAGSAGTTSVSAGGGGGSNSAGTNATNSLSNAVGHAGGNGGDQGGYGGAGNSTYGSGGRPITGYFWAGGGGGGGWYGGAGGWGASGGDGGGGGSSYVNASYCTAHSYGGATGGAAGSGSAQVSGGGCGTSGGNGFVTVTFA